MSTLSVHAVLVPEKQILLAHSPVNNKGGSFIGELNSLPVFRQNGSYLGRADWSPVFIVTSVLSLFRPFLCSRGQTLMAFLQRVTNQTGFTMTSEMDS